METLFILICALVVGTVGVLLLMSAADDLLR